MNEHPKAEFPNVDRTENPQGFVHYLDRRASMPFTQLYKQRVLENLELTAGQKVLDVGCGPGSDLLAMEPLIAPNGQVIGLDYSLTMTREAQQRTQSSAIQADTHQLPFPEAAFDRVRADKTFQHLHDPQRALREIIRVTKAGGKIVICDPDHEMRVIDTPYKDVNRRFLHFRADTLQQGGIAHQLYGMFKTQGLSAITVEPVTWIHTDYESFNRLTGFTSGIWLAVQHGTITQAEAETWVAYLETAGKEERFFGAMTTFITAGWKVSS